MNNQAAFIEALTTNEDDVETRMIYADWLEEHGLYDEAERQRKWPAAKAWMIEFCAENDESQEDSEYADEIYPMGYEVLLDAAKRAATDTPNEDDMRWGRGDGLCILCYNNQGMCDALQDNRREFWRNFAVLTGIAVPDEQADESWFRCAC